MPGWFDLEFCNERNLTKSSENRTALQNECYIMGTYYINK